MFYSGDPEKITDLSYAQFLDAHRDYGFVGCGARIAGDGEIRGEFLETEDCGGRTYIRFQTGEYETVGLAGALLPEAAGETVRFSMEADKVYLFDRETKEAIGAA